MATSTNSSPVQRERGLLGQTVVVIGGPARASGSRRPGAPAPRELA